ncbi:MAG: hypothetical protein WC650_02160 [Candidatus Doudnabacteria bacterium]
MLLSAQKILNRKIKDSAGPFEGIVKGFFIVRETGRIYAFKINEERYVLFSNIKNLADNEIAAFSNAIAPIEKDAHVLALDREKFAILKNQAVTESGDILGEIRDFEFDDLDGQVVKYYVKTGLLANMLKGQLIIHKDQVVALKKEAVIVRDNVLPIKKGFKIWQKKREVLPAGAAAAEG